MTKSLPLWLLVYTLLAAPCVCGQSRSPAPVTLTDKHPVASFSLPPEILTQAPPILALTLPEVENPSRQGVNLFVYLSSGTGNRTQKILIGNVSLYPSDQPAGFLLSSAPAFRKLQSQGANPKFAKAELRIEMEPVHAGEPWKPLSLVIAPPEWRSK